MERLSEGAAIKLIEPRPEESAQQRPVRELAQLTCTGKARRIGCGRTANVTIIAENIRISAAHPAQYRLAEARRKSRSMIASSVAAAIPCQTECTSVQPTRVSNGSSRRAKRL